MGYSGAGGKLFHEKTRSKKSRDTVPLFEEVGAHQVPLVGEEGICRLLLGLRQLHQVFYLKVSKYNIFKYFLMVKFTHIYEVHPKSK
jgi:hypothetical protein